MNNEDQIEYWNGPGGQKWVEEAQRLDAMLAGFADKVIAAADLKQGEQAMDIGCGAGSLTLLAADQTGAALGVDVSKPLIGLARQRASDAGSPAQFEIADASAYRAPAKADAVISRFGVMFFEDPSAAFANVGHSTAPGGRLAFMCWQALPANDWAFAPLQAALPFLKEPPAPADPTAPGPFAFQDKDRVAGLLSDAGWTNIQIEPLEGPLELPGDDVETSAGFMMQLGPLARLIREQGVELEAVEGALVERLSEHKTANGRIAMNSACWLVTASRS